MHVSRNHSGVVHLGWRPAACNAASHFVALIIPLFACAALAADPQRGGLTVPSNGEPFSARLIKIDSDWNILLDEQGQERTIAVADLVRWGAYREGEAASGVVLRDGSILAAEVMHVDGTSITVESAFWPATSISRKSLAGIVFESPAAARQRDRLLRKIGWQSQTKDLALLKNGDRIVGRLTAAPESARPRGDLGLRAFGMALRAAQESVAVSVDDTVAVLLQAEERGGSSVPTHITWLGFRDGSLLAVDTIDVRASNVSLTLSCGERLTLSAEDLGNDVCLVQPIGTTRYLSDLTPIGYQHAPFLELKRTLARDGNVLGGRLRVAGGIYLKGLGMATTSRVVYEVADTDRRFASELALDDAAADRGSAVFRVFLEKRQVDQEASWQAAYTSPIVRGGDSPRPISVDLANTTRIALIVDFADRGDERDYANWLSARFLP